MRKNMAMSTQALSSVRSAEIFTPPPGRNDAKAANAMRGILKKVVTQSSVRNFFIGIDLY
jgi:hypothetical protein